MMKSGITAITFNEMQAMRKALLMGSDNGKICLEECVTEQVVVAAMAAFYRARYGPAAGSTAVQKATGKTATRYFDAFFKKLRWLVLDNPESSTLNAERVDELPAHPAWEIRERDWKELVYR